MDRVLKEKRNFLQLFNVVSTQGEKINDGYEFQGIRAWHDFDGYTCWLKYNDLTVTLLFHNKYQFDYQSEDTLTNFMKKADKLLAQ
jgi:hypothetical protein